LSKADRKKVKKQKDITEDGVEKVKEEFKAKTDEDINLEIHYEGIVADFLKSSMNELEFSAGLSSRDRLIIHSVAQRKGLLHESKGEGEERRIVISKKVEEREVVEEEKEELKEGD